MIELSPYQSDCIKRLNEVLEKGLTSAVMALPTGSGKTFTAVSWLRRFLELGKKVLWFVHRIELLKQARDTFASVAPEFKLTEWTADSKDATGQVVLAMIMSARDLAQPFDIVVVDEAHHAAMPTYEAKLEEIPRAFTLGLTATPTRLDGRPLPFEDIAAQHTVIELAEKGWLAKPECFRVETKQKFRMKVQAGDFTAASLRQLDNETRNKLIADTWMDNSWGKTLCFCSSIEHAEHLASAFAEKDVRALVLHSELSQTDRDAIVNEFRSKGDHVLLNIAIFTEGIDVPDINTIFLCRPTASEVLFLQMVGRGTRICEGKNSFSVVDFVDDMGKYSLLHRVWEEEHLGFVDPEELRRREEEEQRRLEAAERARQRLEERERRAEEDARRREEARRAELEMLRRAGLEPPEDEQERAEWMAAKRAMEAAGFPPSEIQFVLRAVENYVGVATYKGRFDDKPQRLLITRQVWDCIQKFRILSFVRPPQEAVLSSYMLAGAYDIGFDFAEWRNIAWTVWF